MSAVIIKETRHLLLPLQTVLEAVVQYDRRNHGSMLGGEAMQAEFVQGTPREQGLNVAVRTSDESTIEWKHLDVHDLSRAIINYCRTRRIPLPYAAEKTVSITGEGAALAIENTLNLARKGSIDTDISGKPLRYAKGYEPHAILPNTRDIVAG